MRTSDRTEPRHPSPGPAPARRNPYEELGALDDGPLRETTVADFLGKELVEQWAEPDEPAEPLRSRPRRRRDRSAGLALAVKAVVGLVVLASFAALADRWAVYYAEHRAADALKDRLDLATEPEVEIGGFPFLTQLADERIESVRVTVPDVPAGRVTLAAVTGTAHDLRLETDGFTSLRGARVPRLDGEVLVSFDDLGRELGASQVRFTADGDDRIRVRGTLPIAGQDLALHAAVTIRQNGGRSIATEIGDIRLDLGDLATYRPGTGASDGLHLTPAASAALARDTRKARALLSVTALARRLGLSERAVDEALADDGRLAELTGSPDFARQARGLDLVDLALDHPGVLRKLGLDPALTRALSRLTHPVLADRLSFSFDLPDLPLGEVRLRDVRVTRDGIRVRLTGSDLTLDGS